MMPARRLSCLLLLLVLAACDDNGTLQQGTRASLAPQLADPTPPPPVVQPLRIVYRVTGSIANVHITYFSSTQGTEQATTDLPWVLAYETNANSTFVYLAATAPMDNSLEGNLIVQIFVNGALFREARGSGFLPDVAVSGEVTR